LLLEYDLPVANPDGDEFAIVIPIEEVLTR
jgi:hypothetical protein